MSRSSNDDAVCFGHISFTHFSAGVSFFRFEFSNTFFLFYFLLCASLAIAPHFFLSCFRSFSGECLSRMDQLDGIPERVLGLRVKSRWQIVFHYLLPCAMELVVYVSLSTIDVGVAYRHWIDRNRLYAAITLALTLVPALLTFVCVMLSDQWPTSQNDDSGSGWCGSKSYWHFFARQLVNLVCFPIAAVYR